ncbi:MAG: comEA [Firmicutes bacterium]|nr:comEA [Bacillota bacterium]
MDVIKRRWILILLLVGVMLAGTFYGQWQEKRIEDRVVMSEFPAHNKNSREQAKVHINSADQDELDRLPGIGAVLAKRIVEFRTAHGPFQNIKDLTKVKGITEAEFRRLEKKIEL